MGGRSSGSAKSDPMRGIPHTQNKDGSVSFNETFLDTVNERLGATSVVAGNFDLRNIGMRGNYANNKGFSIKVKGRLGEYNHVNSLAEAKSKYGFDEKAVSVYLYKGKNGKELEKDFISNGYKKAYTTGKDSNGQIGIFIKE